MWLIASSAGISGTIGMAVFLIVVAMIWVALEDVYKRVFVRAPEKVAVCREKLIVWCIIGVLIVGLVAFVCYIGNISK